MSSENCLRNGSANSSDSEESCMLSALKLDDETPGCKAAAAESLTQADGAAGGVSPGGSTPGNTVMTVTSSLAEGLDKLLQKQRSDLLFELRKLQHGQRLVTNTDRRETLEEFFSDALSPSTARNPGQPEGGVASRRQAIRPESVVTEVQGLSERRPVSSVLASDSFRRNLEDVIRGSLVRQDRELQQAIRLRAAGFDMGNSRAPSVGANVDPLQQHMENLSQLSHSSRTSSSSHPSGLGDNSVFAPPPPPPPPQQWQPNMYQQPWQQQQQYIQWQQQQQQWQQQQQQWRQQQQQQQWRQQQPQQWQPPVQPQQPWLVQNSPAPQPNSNGGMNMVALLQHVQREETVFEISELVQRQVVSSMLNSNFRGTLENTMMDRLQHTEADGLGVQNYIQSLQQSHRHVRNDFSHLGIHAAARQQSASVSAGGPATWAGGELDTMRRQMEEMQTMLRLTFELQMDMQRSIRQEVAAALSGQHRPDSNGQAVTAPIPPSQPASEGQCVICLEKSVDAVLYQCGHMCCCLSCGLRLKGMGAHCPMCRAPIRDVIRAYRCQRD